MTDHWDSLDRRLTSDAESEQELGTEFDWTNPVHVAAAFFNALTDGEEEILEGLSNPESRTSWGDYSDARAAAKAIVDPGFGSVPTVSGDDADVLYVKVLSHVSQSFQSNEDAPVMAAAVITVVRRPEFDGRCFVQAIGDYWRPSGA